MNDWMFEQLAASNKANIDYLLALGETARNSLERMTELNLSTTRTVLKDAAVGVKSLFRVRALPQLFAMQKGLAGHSLDKFITYARDVYGIQCDTQAEFLRIYAARQSAMKGIAVNMLELTADKLPGNSERIVSKIKSMISANESPYANANKTARQLSEIADSNFTAITKSAVKATASAVAKSSSTTLKKAGNAAALSAKASKAA